MTVWILEEDDGCFESTVVGVYATEEAVKEAIKNNRDLVCPWYEEWEVNE